MARTRYRGRLLRRTVLASDETMVDIKECNEGCEYQPLCRIALVALDAEPGRRPLPQQTVAEIVLLFDHEVAHFEAKRPAVTGQNEVLPDSPFDGRSGKLVDMLGRNDGGPDHRHRSARRYHRGQLAAMRAARNPSPVDQHRLAAVRRLERRDDFETRHPVTHPIVEIDRVRGKKFPGSLNPAKPDVRRFVGGAKVHDRSALPRGVVRGELLLVRGAPELPSRGRQRQKQPEDGGNRRQPAWPAQRLLHPRADAMPAWLPGKGSATLLHSGNRAMRIIV